MRVGGKKTAFFGYLVRAGWRCAIASCCALVFLTGCLLAQSAHSAPAVTIPLTVQTGVPLHIIITNRVLIRHAGEPVEGRLTEPVYVYNREVIPAGSKVLGRIIKVENATRMRRARAILNGDFSPLRTAKVEFDTLILKDGRRLPVSTLVSPGAAPVVHLEAGGNRAKTRKDQFHGLVRTARHEVSAREKDAEAALKGPNKIHRLMAQAKAWVAARSPYHRPAFQSGTVFTARLVSPLELGAESLPAQELSQVGSAPPPDSIVHARLLTPLSSATTHRGAPVEAVITEPLFSPSHRLIIPQGSRLEGVVMQAKPARRLHRDGRLRFAFRHLDPPASQPQAIHGSIEGIVAPRQAHLKLDNEGGLAPAESKSRYVTPALAVMVAAWTATPDRDAVANANARVPGQGGALGQVLAGGWRFGLAGSILSLAVRSRTLTATLGFYGAAWSVYTHLLARGHDVSFPADTSMDIRFGSHEQHSRLLALPSSGSAPRGAKRH